MYSTISTVINQDSGSSKQEISRSFLIRKDRQPNTENPLKLNLSGVIVKHLPYRGK